MDHVIASRNLTLCGSRLNTPRSSASIASTKTLNNTQKIKFEGIVAIVKDAPSTDAKDTQASEVSQH
jgi:hypothetical protein